jgi:hypothetical protein
VPEVLGVQGRTLTRPLAYLTSAAVAAVTVGLSYLGTLKGRRTLGLEVALFLVMMFLIAPLSWEHHLAYVLPGALFAIRLLLYEGARRFVRPLVVAALFVVAWDFPRDDMYRLGGALALTNAVKFFGVFTIWLFLASKLWERVRGDVALQGEAAGVV